MPSFILQPIVENAFKHGISPKEEGGVVRIRINPLRDKGLLYICLLYTSHRPMAAQMPPSAPAI